MWQAHMGAWFFEKESSDCCSSSDQRNSAAASRIRPVLLFIPRRVSAPSHIDLGWCPPACPALASRAQRDRFSLAS